MIKGRVLKYGDDINTDVIFPGRYLHIYEASEIAEHAMEDLDPEFKNKVRKGDIIVAGKNFGCGSSREQAVTCLKYAGISSIIAKSFSRLFYRNAINQGIPILVTDETDKINENDEIEVDFEIGEIKNLSTGAIIKTEPLPAFVLEIINDGGFIQHLKKKMKEEEHGKV